jgi:hypothetical protein
MADYLVRSATRYRIISMLLSLTTRNFVAPYPYFQPERPSTTVM